MFKIDLDKIDRSLLVQNQEVTDPGIPFPLPPQKNVDAFIPAKSEGWFQKHFTKRSSAKEAEELIEKIERIPGAPVEMAQHYFNTDLLRLIELGRRHPAEVKKIVERAREKSSNRNETEQWYFLVQAACGDTRPLFQTFEKIDLKKRLALFRITLFSPHIGDGPLVGELFVKLMASTTRAERENWVEPTLHSVLNRGAWATNTKVQNKLAWLSAIYHGWQREAEELG